MRITTHKIGDTFSRVRLYNLGAGIWSAVAPVYGPGGSLLLNLAVTLTALGSPDADGNTHSLVVLATATQTALWSETTLISEVVFTDSSPTPTIRSAEAYGIKTLRFADGTDSDDPAALIPGALLPALRGEPGISAYDVAVENGFVGSEAAWLASLVGPQGPVADIAAIVNAADSKTTPVDADAFAGIDSAASYGLKKFTWANIKATLKTYFDALYQPLAANLTSWAGIAPAAKQDALVSGTNIKTINSTSLLGAGDIAVSASIAPLVIAGANTVEQRNGTAAQTHRIYNTYTDASNYERGFMRWNSNVLEIGTEASGTGVGRYSRFVGYHQGQGYAFEFYDPTHPVCSIKLRGLDRSVTINAQSNCLDVPSFRSSSDYSAGAGHNGFGIHFVNSTSAITYCGLVGAAVGVLQVTNGLGRGASYGAALEMFEMTAPPAPATNGVRIYAEDNGSGKTRLMAVFATGSPVQIAIEP